MIRTVTTAGVIGLPLIAAPLIAAAPAGADVQGPATAVSCSSPCTIVEDTALSYLLLPGQTISAYSMLPQNTATGYATAVSDTFTNYGNFPGNTSRNYASLPAGTAAGYATAVSDTITNYANLPSNTLNSIFNRQPAP